MIMGTKRAEIIAEKQKTANAFAKSKQYDRALYETAWNRYSVYVAVLNSSSAGTCGGYPMYILVKEDSEPRWATHEEVSEILSSL